jgi:hypothetical protein
VNPEQSHVDIPVAEVRDWSVRLLMKRGMYAADAENSVERLLQSELLGRPAGGLAWLPRWAEAMDLGDIDPRAQLVTLGEAPGLITLDGSTGIGQVAVTRAFELAMKAAQTTGSVVAVIKNSRPLGDPTACLITATAAGYVAGMMTACKPESEPISIGPCTVWGWPGSESPLISPAALPARNDLVAAVVPTALGGTKLASTKRRLFVDDAEHVCFVIDISKSAERSQFDSVAAQIAAAEVLTAPDWLPDPSRWPERIDLLAEVAAELQELGRRVRVPVDW